MNKFPPIEVTVGVEVTFIYDDERECYVPSPDKLPEVTTAGLFSDAETKAWVPEYQDWTDTVESYDGESTYETFVARDEADNAVAFALLEGWAKALERPRP